MISPKHTYDRQTYEISIAGVTLKLKSSQDDAAVEKLVSYVDQKVKEAMAATRSGSFQNATILAALNIAEELILLKKKANHELSRLEDKVSKLSFDLEASKVLEA